MRACPTVMLKNHFRKETTLEKLVPPRLFPKFLFSKLVAQFTSVNNKMKMFIKWLFKNYIRYVQQKIENTIDLFSRTSFVDFYNTIAPKLKGWVKSGFSVSLFWSSKIKDQNGQRAWQNYFTNLDSFWWGMKQAVLTHDYKFKVICFS